MFNKSLFYSSLNTLNYGKKIYLYDKVTSTNDILLQGEYSYGSVVVTSLQTKGRGRSGREWVDTGSSLIFSILLTGLSTEMLMPFNIIAGYSVCNGISLYAKTKLKWPNDCVINNKKVGGMLLEASFSGNKTTKIVFGAGINLFDNDFPEYIADRATSVYIHTKKEIKRELILATILNNMENMMNNYMDGSFKIENLWKKYSANYNKKISIHINGIRKEMVEKGILPTGELIVQDLNTHKITYINTGEIGYDFNC